jgi:hypothetical protein
MNAIEKISLYMIQLFDFMTSSYIFVLIFVILIMYGLYIYLGNIWSNSSAKQYSFDDVVTDKLDDDDISSTTSFFSFTGILKLLFGISFSFVLLIFFIHLMSYIFNVNIMNTIINTSSNNGFNNFIKYVDDKVRELEKFLNIIPEIKHEIKEIKQEMKEEPKEEVFNVSNNLYSYDDSKSVCKAFNSRLATYKEVEDSYNAGGEWCNYGWGESQMALFPTQSSTYDKLQKIKGHENDCGRPGVNGGFISNPYIKFGVNCYGSKPKKTDIEGSLMKNTTIYPTDQKDIELEQKVEYLKNNRNGLLVSPFSQTKWNRV